MSKILVTAAMEYAYKNGELGEDLMRAVPRDKLSIAKVGFCLLLSRLNSYRKEHNKDPLVVGIITAENSDIDIIIDGKRFKLTGSDNVMFLSTKNKNEFNLVYGGKGSAILLDLGDKINNKVFLSTEFMNIVDNDWTTLMSSLDNTLPIEDPSKVVERLGNQLASTIEDKELKEFGLERSEVSSECVTDNSEEDDDMIGDETIRRNGLLTRGCVATVLNVVPHKISNAMSRGKINTTTLDGINDDPKYRDKKFVSVKQLLEFITSDAFQCDDTYPKQIPIEGIRKGLGVRVELDGVEEDESIPIDLLVSTLTRIMSLNFDNSTEEVVVTVAEQEEEVSTSNEEFVASIANAAVEFESVFDVTDMESREVILANLFNKTSIVPANIIYLLNRTLFETKEEIAVLEYMRGNICDIIRFMVPELRSTLRLLTMAEPDGDLIPVDYVAKIKAIYPTEDSIVELTKEKLEEILFPGVLMLRKFRNSLFLFINSIYPEINPVRLVNLPQDEFTETHVTNIINKLIPLLSKATSNERASIFQSIGRWVTDLNSRPSNK